MLALDICLLLLCLSHTVVTSSSTAFISTSTPAPTCPSRTVNYLTHTLPQQCLPSARSSVHNSSTSGNSTITSPASSVPTYHTSTSRSASLKSDSSHEHGSSYTVSNAVSVPKFSVTSIQSVTTFTTPPIAGTVPVLAIPDTAEEESPLESGNFLSFEEWKKQNLLKAGQSENLGRTQRSDQREPRKRPVNAHNALDSLGDDAEIDIDFSGLVPGGPDPVNDPSAQQADQYGEVNHGVESGAQPKTRARSRDAGTTCKERFNYASFDCAANVLKTNREAKSAHSVLVENKDSYMLNQCSAADKLIILELCDDISIDTIVLANFEFFSSIFRTFRVSVSNRYPVKADKWKTLGTFEARNTREVQAFLVENPVIWARYVRIEFLTHYGSEFYCPVSLIRVHGTTMLEEYKHDLEMSREDDEEDDNAASSILSQDETPIIKTVDEILIEQQDSGIHQRSANEPVHTTDSSPAATKLENATNSSDVIVSISVSGNEAFNANLTLYTMAAEVCLLDDAPSRDVRAAGSSPGDNESTSAAASTISSRTTESQSDAYSVTGSNFASKPSVERDRSASGVAIQSSETVVTIVNSSGTESKKSVSTVSDNIKNQSTNKDQARSSSVRQSSSSTQPHPASPTMQESFFKSVQKRLQMLEANSSLSLQYIEDQSRTLRDAFRKVEQRQLAKTSAFLDHLNHTVLSELREFRQQYDQLWQSTVIELALQRERYQDESQAMHARLGILADELIFQKRVSILQTVLIVICLGLVLFSRGIISNYLELPLLQTVLAKSPNSRWINISGDSRANSPQMVRARSAHEHDAKQGILKRHRRGPSEDSNTDTLSPSEMYSPPTPVSFDGLSDAEPARAEPKMEDPEFDPSSIQRPSTSPPVLSGGESPSTPRLIDSLSGAAVSSRVTTPGSSPEPSITPVKIRHPTPSSKHLTWNLPDE